MELSVAIQTHPARASAAEALRQELEAQRVAGVGPVEVFVDPANSGSWGSARPAWARALEVEARRHIVFQDDVILCRDVLASVLQQSRLTNMPMTHYLATKPALEAQAQGVHWVMVKRFLNAQAFSMTPADTAWFLVWEAENTARFSWGRSSDQRMQDFFLAKRMAVMAPVPSLVDHNVDELPSLHGTSKQVGKHKRVARWFIGREGRGLLIDWRAGLYSPVQG